MKTDSLNRGCVVAVILASVCLLGCSKEVDLSGKIYVITNGRNVIPMPGVTVYALQEMALREAAQKCDDEAQADLAKFQARMKALETKWAVAHQSKLRLQAIDDKYSALNTQISSISDQIAKMTPPVANGFLCSVYHRDELARQKQELDDQLKKAKQTAELDSYYDRTSSAQSYNALFYRNAFLKKVLDTGKIDAQKNTPPAWVKEAELRLKMLALVHERDSLPLTTGNEPDPEEAIHNEAFALTREWDKFKWQGLWARIAAANISRKGVPVFQSVKTDSQGVFHFVLPSKGAYVVAATGDRLTMGETEKYFWFTRPVFDSPGSYTLEINNDNERRGEMNRQFGDMANAMSDDVYWEGIFRNVSGRATTLEVPEIMKQKP